MRRESSEINGGNVLPAGLKIVALSTSGSDIVERASTRFYDPGRRLLFSCFWFCTCCCEASVARSSSSWPCRSSTLLTFIVMKYAGLNANLMSLGGLAISIGMIIDATIIQVENVQRHLGELKDRPKKLSTVLQAVLEVRRPSIFGELIIALTFIPIITLQGMEGKMFSPLAITVSIALFASLFLSIFVIPVLCGIFLKPGDERGRTPCSI